MYGGVQGKSRGRGDRSRYVPAVPCPQKYVPGAGDGQIWALLTATGPRERERALYHFPSSRLLVCSCPIFTRVCLPSLWHQLPSTPRPGTWTAEFRRPEAIFSIPDGQLTSALNPKLHFPQILSAKHPCHAARFPQSAPESFRSLDTTPGRTTPKSRARRLQYPCSQAPGPSHPQMPNVSCKGVSSCRY